MILHHKAFSRFGSLVASFLLVSGFVISALPGTVYAFAGGDGTPGNPYRIASCVHLQELDDNPANLSAYFVLASDIVCTDTANWNGGLGWVPLADSTNRFTGTLDGNGHSIIGLYLNREPSPAGLGLFSYTENATFKNFSISGTVSNPSDNLGTCTGAITGSAFDSVTIENVHSTVNVSGSQDSVGGFVGCLLDGESQSSVTDSSVNAELTGGAVGGLIADLDVSGAAGLVVEGAATGGTFTGTDVGGISRTFHYRTWDNTTTDPALVVNDFSSNADITVTGNAGGLFDNVWLDYRTAEIANASFTGTISATSGTGIAGFINHAESTNTTSSTQISQSFVSASLTSSSNNVGGLVNFVDDGHSVEIDQSYFGGVINAAGDRVGGLIAQSTGASTITNSYADAQITGDQYVGGLVGLGRVSIDSSFAFGAISSSASSLGGLAGALSDATMRDSFAAVTVPPNQPTTTSGLIGGASGMTVINSYVDAGRTSQPCWITGNLDNPNTIDCNEVNETGDDDNYFFNNSTNPPLDQWDFDTVWQTNQYFYPCLQWQDNCQTFQPQVVCEMPTATPTTITGRCDIQVRSGYDYGQTTWEARYKQVDDPDYTVVTLEDEATASATVSGLRAYSEYYLEFRFTNNWGTGDWARLEFITTNGPDINISMSSAVDQSLIDFSVYGCTTLGDWQTRKEDSLAVQDSGYSYPKGLVGFNLLDCPTGGEANVSIAFTTDTDISELAVRKVNETTSSFTTLTQANSGLSVQRTTLEGKPAVLVQYKITDGGVFDQDGLANGEIEDPVGIAQSVLGVPNTGLKSM